MPICIEYWSFKTNLDHFLYKIEIGFIRLCLLFDQLYIIIIIIYSTSQYTCFLKVRGTEKLKKYFTTDKLLQNYCFEVIT